MKLHNKVAVITGGGSGIGAAIALRMAQDGANVAVFDINESAAVEVASSIQKRTGREALGLGVDVGDRNAIETAFAKVDADFGSLDILVNNAGVTKPAMIHNISPEDWRMVYRVNVDAVFFGIKAAAALMKPRKFGRIINTVSGAGLMGDIGQLHYSSSKGAVITMTRSAARELARYNITVNAISPTALTPLTQPTFDDEKFGEQYRKMIPLGRVALPEEIAPAWAFLASEDASYITGVILRVDGGRAIGV
jgi:3-oxoacyl-[acyl-carrier protein] reductase